MPQSFSIRQAELTDVSEIVRIWTAGTKDALGRVIEIGDMSYEDFFHNKLRSQDKVFQIWVAVNSDKSILGWQSLSPITNNPAARNLMAESSTYICPRFREGGIGTKLIEHAKAHARNTSLQYIFAFVQHGNLIVLDTALKTGWQLIGIIPPSPKSAHSVSLNFIVHIVPDIENMMLNDLAIFPEI